MAAKGGLWAVFYAEAAGALWELRWMVVLSLALILGDLWFGVSAARKRGEKIRLSRAGRRTLNKAVDYLTYLLLGCILGLAILEPLGFGGHVVSAAIALGLGCLFEIDSIVGHVCEIHGVKIRFSVWKVLLSYVKNKHEDIGEAVESGMKGQEDESK